MGEDLRRVGEVACGVAMCPCSGDGRGVSRRGQRRWDEAGRGSDTDLMIARWKGRLGEEGTKGKRRPGRRRRWSRACSAAAVTASAWRGRNRRGKALERVYADAGEPLDMTGRARAGRSRRAEENSTQTIVLAGSTRDHHGQSWSWRLPGC